jgi:selenocysteine-specific elongation factor
VSALEACVDECAIVLDGAFVRLASHTARLAAADELLWASVHPLLEGAERFRPPRVRDIASLLGRPETQIRDLLKLAGRLGRVDEVAHDHFFLRMTVSEMVSIACDIAAEAPGGAFTAPQLRDRLKNGRKVAIQILDFLDRHGVTLRQGDLRRIDRRRMDLFGGVAPLPRGAGRICHVPSPLATPADPSRRSGERRNRHLARIEAAEASKS